MDGNSKRKPQPSVTPRYSRERVALVAAAAFVTLVLLFTPPPLITP